MNGKERFIEYENETPTIYTLIIISPAKNFSASMTVNKKQKEKIFSLTTKLGAKINNGNDFKLE